MNTRREMAVALLGLPLIAKAAQSEPQSESQTNALVQPGSQTNAPAEPATDLQPEQNVERKPPPPPYSVEAANIISYTLYAEARGEPSDGKIAVAAVIKTRSVLSKISPAEVCLQDRQFSCWNNLKAVPEFYIAGVGIESVDQLARCQCYGLAWVLMGGNNKWEHLTNFYNPDKSTPDWAFELKGKRKIGHHVFGYIE